MNLKKNAAFTLIELLVVFLIIGVLAAVALPQYQKAVAKTRALSLLPLLRAVSDAEQRYFMANGDYTLSFSDLDIEMPAGGRLTNAGDRQTLDYKGFACYLRRGTDSIRAADSAYCNAKNASGAQIEKYFHQSRFICWAGGGTRGYSLCQSVSGRAEPDGTNGAAFAFTF